MSTFRALPARPSLEYARKEAKAHLRRLRAGDPEALARARERHPQLDVHDPSRARLADAQLVLAREHGFASWPRLVRYMGDVERQQHGHKQLHGEPGSFEYWARYLLAEHRARRVSAGRSLAAYVPRFYGLGLDEVFASTVTEDEARLAVARAEGAPSWEVLLERLAGDARTAVGDWEHDPILRIREPLAAADLAALQRVTEAHPVLLQPSEHDISSGRTLMGFALSQERAQGAAVMKPIIDWLESRGFSRQLELNRRLCGHGMGPGKAEDVLALIEQGADPNWVAPNGIPVLEHALLRYWNGEAVDALAAHARPRSALWIAAGLGDVEGVRRSLDARGKPTPEARRLRPDFVAVGQSMLPPPLPDADDEEILVEALFVAMLNRRVGVIEYLASRGAPLDSLIYGLPLVTIAVGSGWADVVEALVRCGADLDLRGDRDLAGGERNRTARELARDLPDLWAKGWENPELRRIMELCGVDPDALLTEINAKPLPTPEPDSALRKTLALAQEDAARLGQPDVRPENLLLGLIRAGGPPFYVLKEAGAYPPRSAGRLDVERFQAEMADRLAPYDEAAPELPLHPDSHAAVDAAIALATERRRDNVSGMHLLAALTAVEDGPVSRLLAEYGASAPAIHAAIIEWGDV